MSVVVYVDDEPLLCRTFEMMLRRSGWDIHTFTDPEEGLRFVESHPVDVVVCDYRMPKMTGDEFRERMTSPAAFYLVSGDLLVGEKVTAMDGVTDFIAKPFEPERLLALLGICR